jgi:intein/homing endonuclease
VLFPTLANNLYPYFVRGYFDGDGCVYVRKNTISIKITSGSIDMLSQLNTKLEEEINIKGSITKDGSCFNLCFYAKKALAFAKYMYNTEQEKELYMIRKYQKIIDFQV